MTLIPRSFFCRLILIGSLLLFVTSCAGLGKRVQPPEVTLANIRVQEVKLMETVFQTQLRVFNTNDFALPVEGVFYELSLNDKQFAKGVSRAPVEIPAFGTEIVVVDIYSSAVGIITSLLDVMERGRGAEAQELASYSLEGKLHLGGNISPSVIPFVAKGSLSEEELPGRKSFPR